MTVTTFEEFVHATGTRLLRTAVLLCGDRDRADDLVQSAYATAFAKWRLVSRADNPLAYTRTILTRIYLSEQRRRRVVEVALDADPAARPRDPDLRPDVGRSTAATTDPSPSATATPTAPSTPTTPSESAPPSSPTTVRLTGRGTAALLIGLSTRAAAAAVEGDSVRGQGGVALADDQDQVVVSAEQNEETYAEAEMATAAGTSLVTVNVQRSAMSAPGWAGGRCPESLDDCEAEDLPGGDMLRTYRDASDKPGVVRLVAEVVSPRRDVRVVVGSSSAAGETSALDPAQLSEVASSPRWAFDVPAALETEGAALAFTSLDVGSTLHPVDP